MGHLDRCADSKANGRVRALGYALALMALSGSSFAGEVRTATVAASERYAKSRIHAFFFGGGYRDIWKAEIELPVLDLQTEGGGLTPTGRFGGLQTAVLGFKSADGRAFSFRGTDKDPSAILPSVLKNTFVQSIVQDQMAAQHPGGPVTAGVISKAAGIITIEERMMIMPDDPALGEYREEFAGMVGSFYEYPTPAADGRPGFHGAIEIIGESSLYPRLERGKGDRVDTQAFLRARLVDILLGDFDRHRMQWRWAKIPGQSGWQPIPEDRDQAFVRYDMMTRVGAIYLPILQNYGPTYPSMQGLVLHGWEQDRWLLARHEWSDWKAIAEDLKRRISDDVIDRAVKALPAAYYRLDGERLRRDIQGRRDALVDGARRFYEHLALEVDVQTSSAAQSIRADWLEDGRLRVTVRDGADETLRFDRTFVPDETEDVRVYLRDGADAVTVTGDPGDIELRFVASGGKKTIDDAGSGGASIYVDGGEPEIREGRNTRIVDEVYVAPKASSGFVDTDAVPPRDWGSDTLPFPRIGFGPDIGLLIGISALHTVYGFRKHPWAARYRITGALTTGAGEALAGFSGQFRPENSRLVLGVDAEYSGVEVVRFYGFGNETRDDAEDAFFRVRNRQLQFATHLSRTFFGGAITAAAGLWTRHSVTRDGDRLIDEVDPFGAQSFTAVGGLLDLTYDTRTAGALGELSLPIQGNPAAGFPTGGILVKAQAYLAPPLASSTSTWGELKGSIAHHSSFFADDRLALALRVGGMATFGRVPYFAAAYLGGGRTFSGDGTVRGLLPNRYAGDAAVYGNLDLRLYLFDFRFGLPFDFGVFGFGDVGRVFMYDEASDVWHPSAGGGIWLAPISRTNALSASVAFGGEGPLFYVRLGFHY